jgi:hypothetical protein
VSAPSVTKGALEKLERGGIRGGGTVPLLSLGTRLRELGELVLDLPRDC